MEALTSYEGFKQVTNQPTHIVPDSQSCIDLIFTDKSNLLSLHVNYHHQIIEIILSNWKSKYFKCILATCGRNVEISKHNKKSAMLVNQEKWKGIQYVSIGISQDKIV